MDATKDILITGLLYKKSRENSTISYWWAMSLGLPEDEDGPCFIGYTKLKQYDELTLEQAKNALKEVLDHNSKQRVSESELLKKIGQVCS